MLKRLLLAAVSLALYASASSAAELKKVGVTLGSLGNPFFVSQGDAAVEAARKINPKAEVTVLAADYDLGKQFTQIDNFISAGVDFILLNAADPQAIAPAVKKAQDAGIRVIAIGDIAQGSDAVVMTDNTQAGTIACQYLVDKIGGKGKVVIVNGPQVSSVVARVKGCKEVLAKYPDIKLLSDDQDAKGSREGGLAVMQSLLTRFDHIDGVFTINDPTAIGVDLAAKQLGRKKMIITSVDGAPDIVAALQADTLIQASAAQEPQTMSIKGIELGMGLMDGKKPAQTTILIPSTLVTRDNAAAHKGW
ncbi:ABC transporter substrate-binding protein [Labrys sp. KNU-23]|uniref:ABC transporter substrate-binding protein n=1 Tax=Labrys sp. KNU-23 TaxID=2789216 RepID=UPI0011EC5BFD|nr:ABC transporter substrate-binding protein [Labrys sp. KNU-23]QEN86533.1 ABC transporter substrate-binding protein [Labrys sp. KNU-23]